MLGTVAKLLENHQILVHPHLSNMGTGMVTVDPARCIKFFVVGDRIRVVKGAREGEVGVVTKVDEKKMTAKVASDFLTAQGWPVEFEVSLNDLKHTQGTAQATRRAVSPKKDPRFGGGPSVPQALEDVEHGHLRQGALVRDEQSKTVGIILTLNRDMARILTVQGGRLECEMKSRRIVELHRRGASMDGDSVSGYMKMCWVAGRLWRFFVLLVGYVVCYGGRGRFRRGSSFYLNLKYYNIITLKSAAVLASLCCGLEFLQVL